MEFQVKLGVVLLVVCEKGLSVKKEQNEPFLVSDRRLHWTGNFCCKCKGGKVFLFAKKYSSGKLEAERRCEVCNHVYYH